MSRARRPGVASMTAITERDCPGRPGGRRVRAALPNILRATVISLVRPTSRITSRSASAEGTDCYASLTGARTSLRIDTGYRVGLTEIMSDVLDDAALTAGGFPARHCETPARHLPAAAAASFCSLLTRSEAACHLPAPRPPQRPPRTVVMLAALPPGSHRLLPLPAKTPASPLAPPTAGL